MILRDGYKYSFSRKEMLKGYLDYLVKVGRQQFKEGMGLLLEAMVHVMWEMNGQEGGWRQLIMRVFA